MEPDARVPGPGPAPTQDLPRRTPLGEILVSMGVATNEDVAGALEIQAGGDKRRIGEILMGMGVVKAKQVARAIGSQQSRVPLESVEQAERLLMELTEKQIEIEFSLGHPKRTRPDGSPVPEAQRRDWKVGAHFALHITRKQAKYVREWLKKNRRPGGEARKLVERALEMYAEKLQEGLADLEARDTVVGALFPKPRYRMPEGLPPDLFGTSAPGERFACWGMRPAGNGHGSAQPGPPG